MKPRVRALRSLRDVSPGRPASSGCQPPDVTFVIPTREEEGYIARSLSHICVERKRSGLSVEIVVVDNASTDDTVREALPLADRVIRLTEARTIAGVRNAGARLARGRFMFHTDADVIVPRLPEFLDRALVEFADPAVVAVTASVMPYPWDSSWRDRFFHRVANRHFELSHRYGAYYSRGECQLVRRSAFEAAGGYDTSLASGEDCDLFRRLSHLGRIVFVSDLTVQHSVRRFRELGYSSVFIVYLREALWAHVFRRSYIHEWPVVR